MVHLPRKLRCWLGDHGYAPIRRVTTRLSSRMPQVFKQACDYCPSEREYISTNKVFRRVS